MKNIVSLLVIALLAIETSAPAQQIFYPTDDTYEAINDCITIYGSSPQLRIRNRYGAGGSDRWEVDAMIKFKLSSIPPGTAIISAQLYLYYFSLWDNNPAGRNLNLHRLLGDWDEHTLNWCNLPAHAPEVSASSIVPSAFGWMSWDVTADVQNFVAGLADNYGWFLTDPTAWNSGNIPQTWFHSKEYPDHRPYLEVFTVPRALQGIVRCHETNAPLAGSSVSAHDLPGTAYTDSLGHYILPLPPGTYSVTFHHAAHCDTTITDIVIEAHETTMQDAVLDRPSAQFSHSSIGMETWQDRDTSATFTIANSGTCPLSFAISDTSEWIELLPASGTVNPGRSLEISVQARVADLVPLADYSTNLRVDYNAQGSPYTILMELWLLPLALEEDHALSHKFELCPNYPNPFNGRTEISFRLAGTERVSLFVADLLGRKVALLIDDVRPPGQYRVAFDGTDRPSGVYFYTLVTP
ncbi:DNRLRE domain-containing protein, partial [bacterium]|nr:DNRLRE domain-containing protein [bacterium]